DDVGNLSIKVTATDTAGSNTSQFFALNVTNINDAPDAGNVTLATGMEDHAYTIYAADLLANSSDVDNAHTDLSISAVTVDAEYGELVDNGDGSWTFTPAHNFNGDVAFNFDVSDGDKSSSATA